MTWHEIKSTLVRRWPEKFELYEEPGMLVDEPDGCGIQSADAGIPYFATELSDIAAICEAIGAVVWHGPLCDSFGNPVPPFNWWKGYWIDSDGHVQSEDFRGYTTREAAELAALGEWLKATEVQS